ncbi:MAG: hypothetical protein ACYDCO_09260 [Armatimonadota bacterium]
MVLRSLLLAAACFAGLAMCAFFAGCSDDDGDDNRQLPDFSQLSILLYYDGELEGNFAQQALDDFGATYTLVESPAELLAQSGNAYDLLVIDNPDQDSEAMLDLLENYVDDGGRMVISTWQSDQFPDHPLWAELGADIGLAPNTNVVPQFRWEEDHPVFTFPNRVPDLDALTDDFEFGVNYFPGNALSNAEAVGGITPEPQPNSATIFVNDTGRTVLNAFLLMDAVEIVNGTVIPNDEDNDGEPDARELWQNEIVYVLRGNPVPVTLVAPVATSTRGAGKSNKP